MCADAVLLIGKTRVYDPRKADFFILISSLSINTFAKVDDEENIGKSVRPF